MKLLAHTRTPIWTGGADQDSKAMKESGIVGSMRFWYEGLLRAQGLETCTGGNETCKGDCCLLFGNTSRSRRFRLRLEGLSSKRVAYPGTGGRLALWSDSPFQILVYPRPAAEEYVNPRIEHLLHTMSRLGGIGAKTQFGFGQFTINGLAPAASDTKFVPPGDDLFTLHPDRFFSLTYSGDLPDGDEKPYMERATQIRAHGLRTYVENNVSLAPLEKTQLFGTLAGRASYGGRIHASHFMRRADGKYSIKIWGDFGHRNEIVAAVDKFMGDRFPGWAREENRL